MTNIVITDIDAVIAEIKTALTPIASTIKTDAKAIGSSALTFIETNGLQDAYQIALTIVGGAVAGTPWGSTLAAVTAAVVADGKTIETGAVAVVAAQAQADLIAAGTLVPPAVAAPAA